MASAYTWTASPLVWPIGSSSNVQHHNAPRPSQSTYPAPDSRMYASSRYFVDETSSDRAERPSLPQSPTRQRSQYQNVSPDRSPPLPFSEFDYRRRSSISTQQPTLNTYQKSSIMPMPSQTGYGAPPSSQAPGNQLNPQYFDLTQDQLRAPQPLPYAEDHSSSGSGSYGRPSPPSTDMRFKDEKRITPPSTVRHQKPGGKTNPYHSHRKAGRGNQDESFYVLEYTKPLSSGLSRAPDLDTSMEASHQDMVFQQLNEILSSGMFNFFARHQFPIPTDPGKRMVRKSTDREWHEWLELAIALCEKRMIPKGFLHNERIREFITTLQNSGEIRHAWAHPSRPLKSDLGMLQLISAGVHVSQMIMDWEGMEKILNIYSETEDAINRTKRRRLSIQKTVRFLTPENLD